VVRKKIEIEVGFVASPQAEEDEMMALEQIAEWFADAILEEAKAEVEETLAEKRPKLPCEGAHT
jgi:hypothetical protein